MICLGAAALPKLPFSNITMQYPDLVSSIKCVSAKQARALPE
jgi:hypothetical protein